MNCSIHQNVPIFTITFPLFTMKWQSRFFIMRLSSSGTSVYLSDRKAKKASLVDSCAGSAEWPPRRHVGGPCVRELPPVHRCGPLLRCHWRRLHAGRSSDRWYVHDRCCSERLQHRYCRRLVLGIRLLLLLCDDCLRQSPV